MYFLYIEINILDENVYIHLNVYFSESQNFLV